LKKKRIERAKIDIFLAGIGGQGILLASEIIAQAGLAAGYDVKKSEVHGMSQRGGTVTSCVRLGNNVYSPLIERGKADIVVSFAPEEGRRYREHLRRGGLFLEAPPTVGEKLDNPRTFNMAMVGIVSLHMDIPVEVWTETMSARVPPRSLEANKRAFSLGREIGGGDYDL
jgi:indolepyruvate ferredoxin oxidoreductase beta subunit